jgi:hypothetical protein
MLVWGSTIPLRSGAKIIYTFDIKQRRVTSLLNSIPPDTIDRIDAVVLNIATSSKEDDQTLKGIKDKRILSYATPAPRAPESMRLYSLPLQRFCLPLTTGGASRISRLFRNQISWARELIQVSPGCRDALRKERIGFGYMIKD